MQLAALYFVVVFAIAQHGMLSIRKCWRLQLLLLYTHTHTHTHTGIHDNLQFSRRNWVRGKSALVQRQMETAANTTACRRGGEGKGRRGGCLVRLAPEVKGGKLKKL